MILSFVSLSGIFLASVYGMSCIVKSILKNPVEAPHLIIFGIGMVMAFIKVVL